MPNYLITVSGVGITVPAGEVDSFEVDSTSSSGSTGSEVLLNGVSYLLNISGVTLFDLPSLVKVRDAEYASNDNFASIVADPVSFSGFSGSLIEPGYQSDHSYDYLVTGAGSLPTITIVDSAYGDNSGTLTATFTAIEAKGDALFRIVDGVATAWGGAGGIQFNGANVSLANVSPSAYNPSHIYSFIATGIDDTYTFNFADTDGNYANNSGSLNVTIEELP